MKTTLGVVLSLAILMSCEEELKGQTAKLVHYQGVLLQEDGTPFDGITDLTFGIFTRPLAEKPIWSETHENVKIENGNYAVFLGSKEPLNLSYYEYFLEVKSSATGIVGPRIAIAGSGYNFRLWFLFAAYTIVWVALFAYALSVAFRQKKIIADLELLARERQV